MCILRRYVLNPDETANGFRPAPNVGDIVEDRFGPQVAGKGAPCWGSSWPMNMVVAVAMTSACMSWISLAMPRIYVVVVCEGFGNSSWG